MSILCDYEDKLSKLHCNIISDDNELIVCQKVGRFEIANNLIDILSGFTFADDIFKCIMLLEYHFLSQTHVSFELMKQDTCSVSKAIFIIIEGQEFLFYF